MPLIFDEVQFQATYPIDEEALQRFLSFCKRRKLRKKSIIVRNNDVADTLYYIIDGSVSVITEDEEGNEVVLAYLSKGGFIGEIGLFFSTPSRTATVRTRSDSEIAEIKYERLEGLAKKELKEEYPHIMYAIGAQLALRLLKTSRRVSRLSYMDVSGRIARTLMDMCKEPDAMSHPEGTQIRISRQELGRIVGCSREVVGRVIKQMAADGMIGVNGMDIVIYHSR
jgi:CRP/FNR family cyclic AMP-dependent transcriptional regulator